MGRPTSGTVTILNGGTTTSQGGDNGAGVIKMGPHTALQLHFPAAFTGATVTFTASRTVGGTYQPVRDSDGNVVSIPVTVSASFSLTGAEADAIAACDFIKIVSAGAEGGDRDIGFTKK